jgi:DNA-binding CsgD family transcriptional regulator
MTSLKLLEREAPQRVLGEAWERAQAGGCLALVSGEAGIGKTSLVTEFAASVANRAPVSIGRCDALFTPRVLGPAHDVAEGLGGGLRRRLETEPNRAALYSAFLDGLRGPARMVIFEDVHWADEATLDLVKYLGRRIGDTRALLILTFRDEELVPRHPLRLVLGDLPWDRCVRVGLKPLSLAAIERLVTPAVAQPQRSVAQVDAEQLHRVTGGNPFYVTEVLAAGGEVPASVRDAVLARAARLSGPARAAADLVSVSPGGLEASIVEASVESGAEGIAECEERGVLRAHGGVLGFRHEIARLALRDALGAQRSRALNARVLAELRARGAAEDKLPRLVHHAQAAEEEESALEYGLAAAKRAAALGAHREAAAHYATAARYAHRLKDSDRAAFLDAFAWECHLTGRPEALEARKEAITLWRRLGEAAREAESLARLSHLLVVLGRDVEGEAAMREAIALLARIPEGSAHVLVYRFHAYVRMLERDVDEAIAGGKKALALAARYGDEEDRVHILNTLGSSMLVADDSRGVAALQESLALAQARGLDFHVANAWGNLGSASGEVHRFQEAAGYLDSGIAWCRARDLDSSFLYDLSWRALAHLFLGEWNEAAKAADTVLGHPAATSIARVMALLAIGRLRARRGDPGVWAALDEARAIAEQTQTLQRLAPTCAARAEATWLEGEDSAAAREAERACQLALPKRHGWFVAELAYWQWKGGQVVAMPDYAAAPYALQVGGCWREAARLWRERGCPYETARALAEGDTEGKLEGLAIFDALGARPAAERVRQSLRASGVRRIPRGPRPSTRAHPAGLTAREAQILALLGENLTNAEIGARLHISSKTVDHHVSAVLAKLGVATRREAIRAAQNREDLPM